MTIEINHESMLGYSVSHFSFSACIPLSPFGLSLCMVSSIHKGLIWMCECVCVHVHVCVCPGKKICFFFYKSLTFVFVRFFGLGGLRDVV